MIHLPQASWININISLNNLLWHYSEALLMGGSRVNCNNPTSFTSGTEMRRLKHKISL